MRGQKLPNGIDFFITLPAIKHNKHTKVDSWIKLNRLEIVEVKLLRKFLDSSNQRERDLVFYAILCLSFFYIRSNAVKYFSIFTSNHERSQFRESLWKYGELYYGISISLLRYTITVEPVNFELSLTVSNLLNKVSIYEFKYLQNCLVFSQGLVTMFENLLTKYKTSWEVDLFTRFLVFASRSYKIKKYRPTVLKEFNVVLESLSPFMTPDLKFQYNHLKRFLDHLILQLQPGVDLSISQVYSLLRKWMIILPPKLQLVNILPNTPEKLLLKFYQSMSILLNNLMPQVNFYFLTTFQGNLMLFNQANHAFGRKTEWNQSLFQMIDDYNIRLSTFFSKRYNSFILACGRQYFNNWDELDMDTVLNEISEVMIEEFSATRIRHYHYPHFVRAITFYKNLETIEDMDAFLHRMDKVANEKLFDYNKPLVQHFMNRDVFKYCIPSEDSAFLESLSRLGIDHSNTRVIPDVRYSLYFHKSDVKNIESIISQDYIELFEGRTEKKTLPFSLDTRSGLDIEDHNPEIFFAGSNLEGMMRLLSQAQYSAEALNSIFGNFNRTKNTLIGQMQNCTQLSEEDMDDKFDDDLNDSYWD